MKKVADMLKSFLSDDPFAAALDGPDDHARGRRPGRALLVLLLPTLGLALMVVGMRARPGVSTPVGGIMATEATERPEKTARGESRAGQILSIEEARRNVVRWRRANCCGGATPRGRARGRAWERSYRERLALFARMYPGQTCPRQKDL